MIPSTFTQERTNPGRRNSPQLPTSQFFRCAVQLPVRLPMGGLAKWVLYTGQTSRGKRVSQQSRRFPFSFSPAGPVDMERTRSPVEFSLPNRNLHIHRVFSDPQTAYFCFSRGKLSEITCACMGVDCGPKKALVSSLLLYTQPFLPPQPFLHPPGSPPALPPAFPPASPPGSPPPPTLPPTPATQRCLPVNSGPLSFLDAPLPIG